MVKHLARSVLPRWAWERLQSARAGGDTAALEREWHAAQAGLTPVARPAGRLGRVLLVPSEPHFIVGSCGDEAMVHAIVHMARKADPDVEIHVVTAGDAAPVAIAQGMIPAEAWAAPDYAQFLVDLMREKTFGAVVAMGADVIDGAYTIPAPARALVAVDLAARLGIPAAVLGASFSTTPDRRLKPFFDGLDPAVHLFMRDAVSLTRCAAFTNFAPALVADCAFMLQPAEVDPDIAAWVAARRAEGKPVIGFNIHPMLLRHVDDDRHRLLIEPALAALTAINAERKVAWLMIPHDRRHDCGDNSTLEALHDRLKPALGDDVAVVYGRPSAGTLKATAGLMDGVVTGRMHLAIASLGMGTPILCVTYKDKFEGLLQHFAVPDDALLSFADFGKPDLLRAKIEGFLDRLDALRAQVRARKPHVLAMSERNFAVFGPPPAG